MMAPYFSAGGVDIYHGRCEDILPALGQFDAAIVDPPYQETSLRWDRWIPTLPELLANLTRSMWWFGSMRSFLDHADDFDSWSMSQDVVWEKHNGSGFHADRFKRVHEHAVHWYRGPWADLYKEVPTTADATKRTVRRKGRPTHMGEIEGSTYTSIDGGPRLMRSVIYARSMHGTALHPTEKPADILAPLIEYAAPPRWLNSGSDVRFRVRPGRRSLARPDRGRHRSRRTILRGRCDPTERRPRPCQDRW